MLPQLVWNKSREERSIYVTFDDGPHPLITPWVLNELDKVNAKATFFVVGDNVRKYPDVIQEIKERGHSIGNHTQHHAKGWGMAKEEYLKEIEACKEEIKEERLFRPPYGRINFNAISDLTQYDIVMWDLLSLDYKPRLDTNKSLNRMKRKTNEGTIVVFHDSEKAEKNLKMMLPNYLRFVRDQGFEMKAL